MVEIVKRFDRLGRIVIPEEMRKNLGWDESARVLIIRQNKQIILRPFRDHCFLCGSEKDLYNVKDKCLCHDCIAEINEDYDCR